MPTQWNPRQTWAVIVGILQWQHAEIYASFPQEQRRDVELVALLKQRGVPANQLRYLSDRQATTVAINAALEATFAAAPADALLLVYYCGHGGMDDEGWVYFASYDADDSDNLGWSVDELPDLIDAKFKGRQALLIADCCHSGHLLDAVAAKKRRVGFASLGSSLASEISTGNWTFTEAIIAALNGEAYTDDDANATITLAELARHIAEEMAFAEGQRATFATTAGFDPQFVLGRAQPRRDARIGTQVAARSEGEWYAARIIDVRRGEVKVHYYGYNRDDEEWLPEDDVRVAGSPRYPVGSTVEVVSEEEWYLATIIAEEAGLHHIRYEGEDESADEWVGPHRIRPLLTIIPVGEQQDE